MGRKIREALEVMERDLVDVRRGKKYEKGE